jgi:peptidoglycan/xylan/chitin deacetylase (PgdA/CDA1 family)
MLDRIKVFDMILQARSHTSAPVLSVLCYHSVGEPGPDYPFDADVIDVTPAQLRQQLDVVARHFTIIDIDRLCHGLESGRFPPNPLLITFDDGYRSCASAALPILQEFGFPATFFIATDYVNHRRLYWWDRINYLVKKSRKDRLHLRYPRDLELELGDRPMAIGRLLRVVKDEYKLDLDHFLASVADAAGVDWGADIETRLANQLIMTWDEVRSLRQAGMDIQSHTRSHRVLQTLSADRLVDELAGSRADIEHQVGTPVRTLAYPVGYSIRHVPRIRSAVQRAGYELGFTNATGMNYLWRATDPFDVRRVSMMRDQSTSMFRGLLAVPPLAYSR